MQSKVREEQDALDSMVCEIRKTLAKKLDEMSDITHLSSKKILESISDSDVEPETASESNKNPASTNANSSSDDFIYQSSEIPSSDTSDLSEEISADESIEDSAASIWNRARTTNP